MASPIKQVELQQKLLREKLFEHREVILDKLFGIKQQSFGLRCWDNVCVVSSDAVIDRDSMPSDVSKQLVKTEFLVDKLNKVMKLKHKAIRLLTVDSRPDFSEKELDSITSFLMAQLNIKADNKEQINKKVVEPKAAAEKSDYTAQYGRYGYFIKCNKCETNTAMKMPCGSCASKNTKVAKKKESYTLHCSDCEQGTVLI